jgi:hypothetical protein
LTIGSSSLLKYCSLFFFITDLSPMYRVDTQPHVYSQPFKFEKYILSSYIGSSYQLPITIHSSLTKCEETQIRCRTWSLTSCTILSVRSGNTFACDDEPHATKPPSSMCIYPYHPDSKCLHQPHHSTSNTTPITHQSVGSNFHQSPLFPISMVMWISRGATVWALR